MRTWHIAAVCWVLSLATGLLIGQLAGNPSGDFIEHAQQAARFGRPDQADIYLRRGLAHDPGRSDARLLLSQLAHARADWATVAAALRGIPDSDSMAAEVRVAEGDAWLKLNRASVAEDCWLRAARLAPHSRLPRHRMVYLYGMQLRRDPWSKLLWELYDQGEAGLREMIQLLIADHVVWEAEEALIEMQRYATADTADKHSRRALAIYLLNAGKIEHAIEELDEMLREDPNDYESALAAVECQLARANPQAAARQLDQFPESARQNGRWWKAKGAVALQVRNVDQAVSDFTVALQYKPFDREVQHKMAESLRIQGDLARSNHHAQNADRLARIHRLCHSLHQQSQPSVSDIRQLVQLCEEIGLIEEARGWVRAGLGEDKTDSFLQSAQERLKLLPATSSRNPPPSSGC